MQILHILNIADLAFMVAGVAVALLMIVMGGLEERRRTDRSAPRAETAHVARKRR